MTLDMDVPQTNGDALPASRKAAVEQGLAFYQETAAERDALRDLVARLQSDIAAQREAAEALRGILNLMESRVNTATLARDEAVARRAAVETVLEAMMALGRAFQIKNTPLLNEREDEVSTIGGA